MRTRFILATSIACLVLTLLSCSDNSTDSTTDINNLLANPSFESDGKASYAHWITNDSTKWSTEEDVPVTGGTWSLVLTPEYVPSPWARTYVTGQSGNHVYRLTVWSKVYTSELPATCSIGLLAPGETLTQRRSASISAEGWTMYTVDDTLDVISTDTIVVELTPGSAGVIPAGAKAYFDLVKLEQII